MGNRGARLLHGVRLNLRLDAQVDVPRWLGIEGGVGEAVLEIPPSQGGVDIDQPVDRRLIEGRRELPGDIELPDGCIHGSRRLADDPDEVALAVDDHPDCARDAQGPAEMQFTRAPHFRPASYASVRVSLSSAALADDMPPP